MSFGYDQPKPNQAIPSYERAISNISSSNNNNHNDDTRSDTTEIIEYSAAPPSLSTPTASPQLSYGTEASTPNTAGTDCSNGHISTPEVTTRRAHRGLSTRRLPNESPMMQSSNSFGLSPQVPPLIPPWDRSPALLSATSRAHSDGVAENKDSHPSGFSLSAARALKPKRATDLTNHPFTPSKGQPVLPASMSNYELGRNAAPVAVGGSISATLREARHEIATPSTQASPPRIVNTNTNASSSGLRVDPPLSTTSAGSAIEPFPFMSPGRVIGQNPNAFSPCRVHNGGHCPRQPISSFSLPPPPAFSVPNGSTEDNTQLLRSPYPPSTHAASPYSEFSSPPPHSPAQSTCSHSSSCHSPHSTASVLSPGMIARKLTGAISVDAVEMQRSSICRKHRCCAKCHRPIFRDGSSLSSPSPKMMAAQPEYPSPSVDSASAMHPAAFHQLPIPYDPVSHDLYPIDQKPNLKARHSNPPPPSHPHPLARRPSQGSLVPQSANDSGVNSPDSTGSEMLPEDERLQMKRVHSQPVPPMHTHDHHQHHQHGQIGSKSTIMRPSPYPAPVSLAHKLPEMMLPPPNVPVIPGSVRPVSFQALFNSNQMVSTPLPNDYPNQPKPSTPNLSHISRKTLAPLLEGKGSIDPLSVSSFASPNPPPLPTTPASAPPLLPAESSPCSPPVGDGLGGGMEDKELVALISRVRNFKPENQRA